MASLASWSHVLYNNVIILLVALHESRKLWKSDLMEHCREFTQRTKCPILQFYSSHELTLAITEHTEHVMSISWSKQTFLPALFHHELNPPYKVQDRLAGVGIIHLCCICCELIENSFIAVFSNIFSPANVCWIPQLMSVTIVVDCRLHFLKLHFANP